MKISGVEYKTRISNIAHNLRESGMDNAEIARIMETDRSAISALISYERKKRGLKSLAAIKRDMLDTKQARIPIGSDRNYNAKLRAWKASVGANG